MNVRFWTFENGSPVKITLKPGQCLSHYSDHPTDEGWSSEAISWEYHPSGSVERHCYTDGTDCDGRMSTHSHTETTPDQLRGNYVAEDGLAYPNWERVDASQRDYSAEAMNY